MRRFKFFVFMVCFTEVCNACDTIISPRTLNGCYFDDLTLVNPSTGFVIAGENCGLEIDKEVFYYQPYVFFANAFDSMKYTLIMLDNDNPICDEGNKFLHWMVTDVDGRSMKYGLGIYGGQTIAAYVPPDPAEFSCVHRYSIFIFEQPFHPFDLPELPEDRFNFNIFSFIEEVGFCGPVASIEFRSRY